MDTQRQTIKRPRRGVAEIARILAEYETSGLGQAEFCRSRQLGHGTLSRYLNQRQQRGRKAGERNRLIPVEVSGDRTAAGSPLVIVLPAGRRIEVGRGFDTPTLRQLLSVLEGA
jgi:hypothetical protein